MPVPGVDPTPRQKGPTDNSISSKTAQVSKQQRWGVGFEPCESATLYRLSWRAYNYVRQLFRLYIVWLHITYSLTQSLPSHTNVWGADLSPSITIYRRYTHYATSCISTSQNTSFINDASVCSYVPELAQDARRNSVSVVGWYQALS